jgi:uncharacterized protein
LTPPIQSTAPLTDTDLARLEALLDALPAPLQPLDICALDGFLCGVLLQPQRVALHGWLPLVTDIDGREAAASPALQELQALVQRRYAELDAAIENRQWFDPWIYQLEDDAEVSDCVLPWVAGFAAAMEHFPALMALSDPELVEPLALIFMHFDADDLEDADALLAVIETLEPPAELADAVQDTVRALMLMADVTRPVKKPAVTARTARSTRSTRSTVPRAGSRQPRPNKPTNRRPR